MDKYVPSVVERTLLVLSMGLAVCSGVARYDLVMHDTPGELAFLLGAAALSPIIIWWWRFSSPTHVASWFAAVMVTWLAVLAGWLVYLAISVDFSPVLLGICLGLPLVSASLVLAIAHRRVRRQLPPDAFLRKEHDEN